MGSAITSTLAGREEEGRQTMDCRGLLAYFRNFAIRGMCAPLQSRLNCNPCTVTVSCCANYADRGICFPDSHA